MTALVAIRAVSQGTHFLHVPTGVFLREKNREGHTDLLQRRDSSWPLLSLEEVWLMRCSWDPLLPRLP